MVYGKTWALFPTLVIVVAIRRLNQYIAGMQEKLKQQVLDAFLLVMRPIVRILLRYGIGYREFVEVAKTAYVDVASTDFGLRGRPTNISRVAVMTGLTRKEVKRLRDKIESGDSRISVKTTPLADVLHHWHAQEEFTDSSGRPVVLPFSGAERSFSSLVKKFGGDIPAGAMRTELARVGAIVESANGELEVVDRVVVPKSDHDGLIAVLVHGAYALLSNIENNSDPKNANDQMANRFAYTQAVTSDRTSQIRRIAKDRIAEFAQSIDDIFIAYEALHEQSGRTDEKAPVAVGVFYFEERDENADYDW